jgi:hypothetical protein
MALARRAVVCHGAASRRVVPVGIAAEQMILRASYVKLIPFRAGI